MQLLNYVLQCNSKLQPLLKIIIWGYSKKNTQEYVITFVSINTRLTYNIKIHIYFFVSPFK